MLNIVADRISKSIQDHLPSDENEQTKGNVAKRPPVFEGVHHQEKLHNEVYREAYGVDNVQDDEQCNGVRRAKAAPRFKGEDRDQEGYGEHDRRGRPKKPNRQSSAILIELESDEPVDEKTCTQRRGQAVLDRDEPGKRAASRRDDACVNDQRANGESHVDVKERDDLLPT